MTFRGAANIDPNQHKGLVISNSITNAVLIPTGLSLTNAQPLHVAIVDGAGSQVTSFGGGTQYAEGDTTSPGTGTLSIARYTSSPPSLSEGELYGLQLDSSGNLKVTGSISVGGTTDNSAFTAGTSTGTPAMGFYHSSIDTVTDGRAAAVGITSKRAMMVNLQTAAGAETGVAATPLQVSLANTGSNTNKLLVTPDANSAVNIAQINGVTPLMGNGVTGTGSQRVTIASDNTAFSVNATLSAETTKVIGTVNISAGQSITVTQATGSSLHAVLDSGTLTTLTTLTGTTTLTPGTGATNLGKAEDAAAASGDTGVFTLGVRNDDGTTAGSGTNGDYTQFSTDANGRQIMVQKAKVGTQTSVAGSGSSVTILAANSDRLGASVYNDSAAILYLRYSSTAATTSTFTVKMFPEDYHEIYGGYTGAIVGIWASAVGSARVTELSS